jgi:hypothetical protein
MSRTLLALALILAGCGRGSSDADPVVVPTKIDPETAGTIKGRVTFDGTPPANLKLPVGGNAECSALHSGPAFDEAVARQGRQAPERAGPT